jgi:hypothetical protein
VRGSVDGGEERRVPVCRSRGRGTGRTKVGGGADGWGRGEGDWEKGREERGPAGGGPEEMVGPELDWALC